MTVKITQYVRPKTLEEALAFLAAYRGRAMVVGGGVSMVLSSAPRPVAAVDLSGLGLDHIERSQKCLHIGATATLAQLEHSAEAATLFSGLFARALGTAGTPPLRNQISVAGNIVQCYNWSTLPVLLLALDARICLARQGKTRSVSAALFFEFHPLKFLEPGEIVTGIEVPLHPSAGEELTCSAGFLKYALTANDYGLVNACALFGIENGTIRHARLVLGAVSALPIRCMHAEQQLVGLRASEAVARETAQLATADLRVRGDIRVSRDYHRRMAAVYLERAIEQALGQEG